MKLLLLLFLVATCALALEDALHQVLRSPTATLKLYDNFKTSQHLQYGASEDRMRFRLFRRNAEFVATANSAVEDTATYGLNLFSSMTAGEKQQYLGLNATGHLPNPAAPLAAVFQGPSEQLWVKMGAVTTVKNQGSCGSCWTFGAVGGLETRYHQFSGKLRDFAEQEYLDCVYESSKSKDGCKGGWSDNCYEYSRKAGGRLAAAADYAYQATDGSCKASSKQDAMVAYKITGSQSVGQGEAANIAALATGSLSVAFQVTNYFQQYKGGIMKDTTCSGRINHAVTAVGYTPSYVLVKNSWGGGWGERGFVKFARGHSNCGLFDYSSYPILTSTGRTDTTPSDAASNYDPDEEDDGPAPEPDCVDSALGCVTDYCIKFANFAAKHCRKTCGLCGDESACPSGTMRCPDGICRHEHMC